MVGLSGIEPLTSPLSGVRSNQLSYRPEADTPQPSYISKSSVTERDRFVP